jgi:4'-phosphopantetheinyl transferase
MVAPFFLGWSPNRPPTDSPCRYRRTGESVPGHGTVILDPDSIHLWCAFYDEIRDDVLLHEYEQLLSESERQRRSRFVFAHDQHCFLVTRALLRTVLSRYIGDVTPAEWIFAPNVHGRPEIVNDHPAAKRVSFNISHTRNLVVLALTHSRELGVDTENVRRAAPLEIADRFFAAAEVASLHALPPEAQPRRFFEYWTLKESYIKARAMGLSIPLDTLSFDFVGNRRVVMRIDTGQPAPATNWWLWQSSVRGDYLIALCAERDGSHVPRVLIKETVPMMADCHLTAEELRVSA